MRVVSLNAWCGGMVEPLIDWLPDCRADVLCLQEVTWTPDYHGWVTYTDADRTSRQRASLFDDVRAALPDHQAQFLTCDTGPVRCADGVVRRQQFGIATFVTAEMSLVRAQAAFVHGRFRHHEVWPAEDRGRIGHAIRVADADGRCATVAHFHGVRMAAGKHDTPARRAQAEQVAALVDRVREAGDHVVVAGDMNVLPDSETFDVLGRVGLTDLVGTADTRTPAYKKPVRHANYLLVSDPAAVASFEIVSAPEVSDHCPLVVDVRLDRPSRPRQAARTAMPG